MLTNTLENNSTFTDASHDVRVRASGLFERILLAMRRYRMYRRGVSEMQSCSDRTLRDLGIYRGDIERLAKESAYGKLTN